MIVIRGISINVANNSLFLQNLLINIKRKQGEYKCLRWVVPISKMIFIGVMEVKGIEGLLKPASTAD